MSQSGDGSNKDGLRQPPILPLSNQCKGHPVIWHTGMGQGDEERCPDKADGGIVHKQRLLITKDGKQKIRCHSYECRNSVP